jgi:hypothetical protein
MLSLRRFRWLGRIKRMEDGRIPRYLVLGVLHIGSKSRGRPLIRYRDVCKRDMQDANCDLIPWDRTVLFVLHVQKRSEIGLVVKAKMFAKGLRLKV